MTVLVRKISRAKWEVYQEHGPSEISADAVTSDLRTTNNTLSFWRCESPSTGDLQRAFLALAASMTRPDRIDIVFLEENLVRDHGISAMDTLGNTPVESLRAHHVDILRLSLDRLCDVAKMISASYRNKDTVGIRKSETIAIVVKAVKEDLLLVSSLKDEMKDAVEAALER